MSRPRRSVWILWIALAISAFLWTWLGRSLADRAPVGLDDQAADFGNGTPSIKGSVHDDSSLQKPRTRQDIAAVSYTHLTLPTICSV